MHFVCCIKQVPDTAEVKIDPDTNTLIRSGVESIINPYDAVALEAAIRLKEKHGGKVTAVSMGPPQAADVLRTAVSLGADEAILLSDRVFAGADTLATTYTLSRAVEKLNQEEPVDLIFCGKQAVDGDTAQTGAGLATRLGFTQLTYIVEIQDLDAAEETIRVKRKVEGGFEIIDGPLPALLTAELELAQPRRASLPLLIQSIRAEIKTWDAATIRGEREQLGLRGSPTWVKKIFAPPPKAGGPRFDAATDLRGAVNQSLDALLADREFAAGFFKRWES